MAFSLRWTPRANAEFLALRRAAEQGAATRSRTGKRKKGRQEGTFGQVGKALRLLSEDPKHRSLNVHKYDSLAPPSGCGEVWEAYAQNNTPGAYRIFWAYGPAQGEITIVAITPHP